MTVIIGLTGGIASGKSTVAHMFQEKNIPVIDADEIAREVVAPGEPTLINITKAFGTEVLHDDGTLNRQKLGEIIFADEDKRQQLNNLIHPAIREQMLEQRDDYIAKKVPAVVLDIPLLFESELTHFVEKILVVYVDETTQLKRLLNRNELSKNEAKQRIASQLPLKDKVERADAVIDNNGSVEQSAEQLDEILKQWNIY